jgi:hypothetical protein
MKRFKFKCGTVITVDDQDAHLLRFYVWHVWNGSIQRSLRVGNHVSSVTLAHAILTAEDRMFITHRNGDRTDFRRANLEPLTREEFYPRAPSRGRRRARANRLAAALLGE